MIEPRLRPATFVLATVLVSVVAGCGNSSDTSYPAEVPAPPLPGRFTEIMGGKQFTFPPLDPQGMMAPPVTGGLFADLDGDGKKEVIMTQLPNTGGTSFAYKYEGGQLVPADLLPVPDAVFAALDLDGDGILDLVYAGSVMWGTGGGQYVPGAQIPGSPFNIAALWDVDGNGLVDLIATPWCTLPHIYLQMTPRNFVDGASLLPSGPMVAPNATFIGDVGNDHLVGAIGFGCADVTADLPNFYVRQGLIYSPVTLVPGLSFTKGSSMGATTGADLDGDGLFDMLVANSPQHVVVSNRTELRESFYQVMSDTGKPMIPWSILLMDLDLDGRQDVLFTHGADSAYSDRVAMIGPERTTGHWNSGHGYGRFSTLGDLDILGDWRSLGVGDLDNDGDPDLILGGFGINAHVYLNETTGNAVALRLLNKQGSLAFGARLTLTSAGNGGGASNVQIFEMSGIATEKMINEPLIYTGLGAATNADLDITWPDGTTQHESIKSGATTTIKQTN